MWQPPSLGDMQAMLPQYQFVSLLGRGGMGAVYKAVQVLLDLPVAIKVLPGDLIDDTDAQFAERFKNEARTMAKMNHPAIVNVFDFGETNTGLLFFVMEFIDGTDVARMILKPGQAAGGLRAGDHGACLRRAGLCAPAAASSIATSSLRISSSTWMAW